MIPEPAIQYVYDDGQIECVGDRWRTFVRRRQLGIFEDRKAALDALHQALGTDNN
jgi:hypothetical protein